MSVRRLLTTELVPYNIRKEFRNLAPASIPEEDLWRDVAARVILDACGHTGASELDIHDKLVREARNWFTLCEDVEFVFDLADVDFRFITDEVLEQDPLYLDLQ